ncbi:endonuclease/exonuclease/phosphatase family protein [Luteolibacter sp. Populi]|uniref:endonuclease/exonuclease/phosphatase family protein n=1 Tax=Luteolibacter sp. Populi TaxID=3230487 RepID=UPI0034661832
MIQIDGLSRTQLERAVQSGRMPFLARLIKRGHFTLENFYSGIPATTPAVQGEIFYGVRAAVPAFQFLHRKSGKVLRMFEAESAALIEKEMLEKCPEPLLKDGHAYSNIYRAGAIRTRYCSQDLAPDELLRRLHPFKSLLLILVYLPKILRMIGLAALELFIALGDAVKGLYEKESFWQEIKFVPARVVVCVLVRELIRFRILLDIERGTQTIHGNFLGYDEQAHRRGPGSAFAHWTLKGIDRTIREIYRAGHGSAHRDYELMIYSDHGQEHTEPYEKRHGRELDAALTEVFASGPLAGTPLWMKKMPELVGSTLDRCRAMMGRAPVSVTTGGEPDPAQQILVAAMGPIGHLYFPKLPDAAAMEAYARALVAKAGIPLVLLKQDDGTVKVWNGRGEWALPRDRAEVLGPEHPFLDEATEDFVKLCFHENAGDIVFSGWDPQGRPMSFPLENGAHCGPGYEETRGFLLVPDRIRRWHVSHLARTGDRVRGEDLRKIAMHYLGRDGGVREERVAEYKKRERELPLRVMTYNIHSCRGTDGKLRPERIARVINHYDPDVVAVQEVDAHRPRSGGHDQGQLIADHLRMSHVFHAMLEEETERYGIAIFSRYPFQIVKQGLLTPPDRGFMREGRGAIWVKMEIEGHAPFHFVNTHFGLGRAERHAQADELLGKDWLGGIPADEAVLLCGDFNSGPRSKVFRKLAGKLGDAQRLVKDHRPLATFPSVSPMLRLDHVFASRHFTVESVERTLTPTSIAASDHLPLCVELTLHPIPLPLHE